LHQLFWDGENHSKWAHVWIDERPTTSATIWRKNSEVPRQPLPPKSVTYVSGTICQLCLRLDPRSLEARVGFEPTNGGFADLSLGPLGYRAGFFSIPNPNSQPAMRLNLVHALPPSLPYVEKSYLSLASRRIRVRAGAGDKWRGLT
jgi:hypothetical protein